MNTALTDDARIEQKRQLLRRHLHQRRKPADALRTPDLARIPRERDNTYPLAFAQRGLWIVDRMAGSSALYNVPRALKVEGAFDVDAAERALARIVSRHEVLRTTYAMSGDDPVQVVADSFELEVSRHDLRDLQGEEQEERVRALIAEDRTAPFDLARDLMVRASYLHLRHDGDRQEGLLLLNMHHIAADGWSMRILIDEFARQYTAIRSDRPDPLPPLTIQYVDYALWHRQWLEKEVVPQQLSYWEKQLSGAPTVHGLPLDKPRPQMSAHAGDIVTARVAPDVSNRLRQLAAHHGTTTFVVLHAAFSLLLSRHCNTEDIVIGTPTANRRHAMLEPLIGFFVNTLVLRTCTGYGRFTEYLEHVKQVDIDAQANQDVPFEYLVEHCRVPRTPQHMPLVQILLSMNDLETGQLDLPGVKLAVMDSEAQSAKFDLNVNATVAEHGIAFSWLYDRELFDRERIERMSGHLLRLLSAIVDRPDAPLRELRMLSDEEEQHLLYGLTGIDAHSTDAAQSRHALIHERFESQAARHPENVAIVADDGSMTYRQLNEAANRLAQYLREQGVRGNTLVGLCLERSMDMVVGVLAILKAGGAYVPLDPSYPRERLQYMLEDTALEHLLTESKMTWLRELPVTVQITNVDAESHRSRLAAYPTADLPRAADLPSDAAAYVIYTSGSTGRPKGVLQTHENVSRLFDATERYFEFAPEDVWTLFHSLSFDFSVWELWGALLYGGKVVIPTRACTRDPQLFVALCREQGVTVLNQTPSAFNGFMQACLQGAVALPALRFVVFGGEALKTGSLVPWWDRYGEERPRLVNMYGITETTVHASLKPLSRRDAGHSVIGQRLADQALYLLDAAREPVPLGAVGEIYVGGAGLARGYLNQPLLTRERFITNPFASHGMRAGGRARIYKSGDLARYTFARELIYRGRNDEQVKIRGLRIELGEIEHQLTQLPGVQVAVVQIREQESSQDSLVAYVVPTAQRGSDRGQWVAKLREELSKRLPDYMVPGYIVVLDSMPLTDNGKVDRARLPRVTESDVGARPARAPGNDLERYLCGVWREVLALEAVGIDDSFFDLGGHSLSAIRVVNQVQKRISAVVHLIAIFKAPTVARFAEYLILHYRDALRACGLLPSDASSEGSATKRAAFVVGDDAVHVLRRLVPVVPSAASSQAKNRRAIFVLSPPRSGSTLLRVMLGGHPRLFAPPELELLAFDTLAQRRAAFSGPHKFWLEGTLRALMACKNMPVDQAERLMSDLEAQGATPQALYEQIHAAIGDAILVDKTPSYAYAPEILRRAESCFERAHYIHLVRHPHGMISSFEQAHLDRLLFLKEHELSARELAELLWVGCHRNIVAFLQHIPAHRQHRILFEDLVSEPQAQMRGLCEFLDLPYDPAMLQPYDAGSDRMTDGVHGVSRMLGDVKFHEHRRIESEVGDAWKDRVAHDFLSEASWRLATTFGYRNEKLARRTSTIGRAPRGQPAPLSFSQQRLWIIDRLQGDSAQYNVPVALRVKGTLDLDAAELAIQQIIARHEPLRTVFAQRKDGPVQIVRDDASFQIARHDLQDVPAREREARIRSLVLGSALEPFDLTRDLMVRAAHLRLSHADAILVFTLHHIAADGWSIGIFVREFVELYRAALDGNVARLSTLPARYCDYAVWQRERLDEGVLQRQLQYWQTQLKALPAVHGLPLDYPRAPVKQHAGERVVGGVSRQVSERLEALARSKDVTLFMIVHAALALVLSRHSRSNDIVIGIPVANRPQAELESLIGFFANTLVLRTDTAHELFGDYLNHVRRVVLDAQANQDVTFEHLLERVYVPRSNAHAPLYQITFTMTSEHAGEVAIPGLTLAPHPESITVARFDLDITAVVTARGLSLSWVFDKSLFRRERIEQLNLHLERLLGGIADNPAATLRELPMLSPGELRHLLRHLNNTRAACPQDQAIHQLFEQQVERHPQRVAVVFEGRSLTYRELNEASNRIARHLRERGVGSGTLVGLCLPRSLATIIGILAVLKAGGAYVPLDPSYPSKRLEHMLIDSGADIVVTQSDLMQELPFGDRVLVLTDEALHAALYGAYATSNLEATAESADSRSAAYVIYTSGSTGQPKGVVVEHLGAINMSLSQQQLFGVTEHSRVLLFASLGFDASVSEWMMALLKGAALYVCSEHERQSPAALRRYLIENAITHATLPPAFLQHIELIEEYSLACLIVAGEACDPALADRWAARHTMFNAYGPTEIAVCATVAPVRAGGPLTIGRPIANTRLYVLGPLGELLPPGATGELYIGGMGVARGYLNRADLTAERFVVSPFAPSGHDRLYRTGDLVRYAEDGNLEFIGRVDEQVKIRGVRIETAEIEVQLRAYPAIAECVVVAREEAAGEKRLVAYYTVEAGAKTERGLINATALRGHLLAALPEYMVPAAYVVLESLPLTPNGKTDRQALPAPAADSYVARRYEPATGEIEQVLARIWTQLLGVERVGRHDNFFELGGHSLSAIRLAAQLRAELGIEVPIRDVFDAPELMTLARRVEDSQVLVHLDTARKGATVKARGWL